MIATVISFLSITLVVGLVNLLVTAPGGHSRVREFLSYVAIVIGGISLFTALVVTISVYLQ